MINFHAQKVTLFSLFVLLSFVAITAEAALLDLPDFILQFSDKPFIGKLISFWSDLGTPERISLSFISFFIFAGATGLDGGKPAAKIQKIIPIEDAISDENTKVFLEIEIDSKRVPGKIVLELFEKRIVKQAENFKKCILNDGGINNMGLPFHFKGTEFHRIIPGFMCQGGCSDKNARASSYGSALVHESELGFIKHTKPGLLSCASSGKDSNGSQFLITVSPAKWLDGKHVVFGQVTDGLDIVMKMNKECGSEKGEITKTCKIVSCGVVKKDSKKNK